MVLIQPFYFLFLVYTHTQFIDHFICNFI